jgi:septation ring formation regulator EzrA
MPRPHRASSSELELSRKIDSLSTKLLQANATLRLKVLYCEKLEYLLHQRHERIDKLFALLEQARQRNMKLEAECEHLAALIAAPTDGGVEAA